MRRFLSLVLLPMGAIIASCNQEEKKFPTLTLLQGAESTPEASVSPIVKTDMPDSGKTGQEITVTVSHVVFNRCGSYWSQRTVQEGNTFYVTFYAKYLDEHCLPMLRTLETSYKFIPWKPGRYTFNFIGIGGEYQTKMIVIN